MEKTIVCSYSVLNGVSLYTSELTLVYNGTLHIREQGNLSGNPKVAAHFRVTVRKPCSCRGLGTMRIAHGDRIADGAVERAYNYISQWSPELDTQKHPDFHNLKCKAYGK